MNKWVKYDIDLLKDDGTTLYGSAALLASSNVEAIEKAKHWATSRMPGTRDAWLQINLNGIAIRTLSPGEF
jgi:hypothetical protein